MIFRVRHWQFRMHTATCWSCETSVRAYEFFPAATFTICHFRCNACEVEWTAELRIDNGDQLPEVVIADWQAADIGLTI